MNVFNINEKNNGPFYKMLLLLANNLNISYKFYKLMLHKIPSVFKWFVSYSVYTYHD